MTGWPDEVVSEAPRRPKGKTAVIRICCSRAFKLRWELDSVELLCHRVPLRSKSTPSLVPNLCPLTPFERLALAEWAQLLNVAGSLRFSLHGTPLVFRPRMASVVGTP